MAAPTIVIKDHTLEITFTDATTDFVFGTTAFTDKGSAGGLFVKAITFEPSGADTMVIREGSVTGPAIIRWSTLDTNDQRVKYFGDRGQRMKFYIEGDDITLTTPANAKLIFDLA